MLTTAHNIQKITQNVLAVTGWILLVTRTTMQTMQPGGHRKSLTSWCLDFCMSLAFFCSLTTLVTSGAPFLGDAFTISFSTFGFTLAGCCGCCFRVSGWAFGEGCPWTGLGEGCPGAGLGEGCPGAGLGEGCPGLLDWGGGFWPGALL